MKFNLPTKITLFRIFLVPILIVFLISPALWSCLIAAAIFGVASITDWLDGYLARKRNETTLLGELLDPIADKLLITAALIPLVELDRVYAWIVVIIIGREIAISGLRMVAAANNVTISPSKLGKLKTVVEIVAILFLILDFNFIFHVIGQVSIAFATLLALVSGYHYFKSFWDKSKSIELT